jgi:hypothetical protein
MKLTVLRLGDDGETTIGAFYVNGVFKCFTIEDQEQTGDKVMHETRVPNGTYKVALRNEGGHHNRYSTKFPDIHKGMLCIYNEADWKLVTDTHSFQYILIHVGNNDDHTSGCLLLNYGIDGNHFVGNNSTAAYRDIYPEIAAACQSGEEVTIEYIDVETGK